MGKKRTHGLAGNHDIGYWKKYLIKIFDYIEKHIKVNLYTTDERHMNELLNLCLQAKRNIGGQNKIHKVLEVSVIQLTYLVFLLMGRRPKNWEKKILNRTEHYKLDRYRTVTLSQNAEQKKNMIIDHIKDHQDILEDNTIFKEYRNSYNGNPDDIAWCFLIDTFNNECRTNNYEFVEWFKKNFEEIYLRIFFPSLVIFDNLAKS